MTFHSRSEAERMLKRYTLFSVDDSRKHYQDQIREVFSRWDEVAGLSVDGRVPDQLAAAQAKHPYDINFPEARLGHLGIWYGVLNALEYAPIITIEDDAILGNLFYESLVSRVKHVPKDFDFFSLFVPRDSDHMFSSDMAVNQVVTRTYQRYGGVSMLYSKQGAEKIKALLERDGITGQYDDTLYQYAKEGELNGYCSRPDLSDLVYISGMEESIVQETNFV